MPYVITDACAKDFVCLAECATSAIAPSVGDPAAGTVSQVYLNPDECIDCGNCAIVCRLRGERSARQQARIRGEEPSLLPVG